MADPRFPPKYTMLYHWLGGIVLGVVFMILLGATIGVCVCK